MRVLMIVLAALLFLVPAALASESFTDPRGDSGDGPDISAVTLSHTDSTVTIAVDFASSPPLGFDESEGWTDMLLIGIHTDDDLSRVDVEFYTGVHGADLTAGRIVSGSGQGWKPVGTAEVTVEGSTVALELQRSLIGDPEEIAIDVAAGRELAGDEAAGGGADEAPASGAFGYALDGDGAPAWLWPVVGAGAAGALVALALVLGRRAGRPHRVGTSH
ncbi:MAG TPA: hypothetical protein VD704_08835 [Gaiellaceae bacterium]|nr:hypothetical protein [Gaiellaceae bacterium]